MVKFLATLNIAQLRVYIAGIQTLVAVLRSMITTVNIAKAAVIGLKVALGGIIVTAIFTGLDLLAQRLLNIGDSASKSKQNVRELAQELDQIAGSADIAAATQKYMEANTELAIARKKYQEAESNLGITRKLPVDAGGGIVDVAKAEKAASDAYADVIAATTKLRQTRQTRDTAVKRKTEEDLRTQQQLKPVDLSAGDEKGKTKKAKELDEYNKSQLQFIKDQFDIEKQRLDKQLQGQLISQTQYDISLAELELESTKLEIAERYRLEVEKTNKDNLSASDKALKLKDLEINKTNALTIAEDKRNLAIGAARQKIIKPIIDEIDKETLGIQRQALQMEALKEGRLELTSAQEAELAVKERYADLATDERGIAQGELDLLTQIVAQRLENVKLLEKQTALTSAQRGLETIGAGLQAGFTGSAAGVFEQAMEQYGDRDYATQLANVETAAMQLRSVFEGLQGAIQGVSSAFANVLTEGVAGMISGTATAKEVFAGFLQSVGQALSQAASQMIATYIAIGIAKLFAGLGGGGGGADMSKTGISETTLAPMRQYSMEGPLTGAAGFAGYANGGIAPGGFRAFANGGVVSGPTLGLVGEGKYNEAVVPLPDGKSIPVQLGGRSARDMMGNNAPGMPQAPSLNMKFETTKINGVEYVSREQLEQAMASTRRAASREGAAQGSQLALSKLKNSPTTRRQLGF
jgi:hypothetical protein